MKYVDALKKVQAKKTRENFMAIKLGYDHTLLLPYKDGVAFMNSLSSAERLIDAYGKPARIQEYNRDAISFTIMSGIDYERHKIAALLNVTLEEVIAAENPQPEPEETPF